MKEFGNPEKTFLKGILSLADNSEDQRSFLEQLGTSDFNDLVYRKIFEASCNIITSGSKLNVGTLAEYIRGKVDFQTFRRISLEMKISRYVDCTPDVTMKLQSYIEHLKMLTLDRKYKEAS